MFLSTIKPLMRGTSAITLTISSTPDGAMCVLLQPALEQMDAETADQTLAELQRALVRPLRVLIPGDIDPDAAFAEVFTDVAQSREQAIDQLAQYREHMAEAANQARLAQSKKTTAAATDAKKPGGKKASTSTAKASSATPPPDEHVSGATAAVPPPPDAMAGSDADGAGERASTLFD